ncbi:MAG: hypothetical protein WDM79_18685 [Terricaulis sp.]
MTVRSQFSPAARPAPYARKPDNDPPPKRPSGAGALPVPVPPPEPAPYVQLIPLPIRVGRIPASFWGAELPALNRSVEQGEILPELAAGIISAMLSKAELEALARIARWMNEKDAVYLLGALGVIASSVERHDRKAYGADRSGFGLSRIQGLEAALSAFGMRTKRAPRDSAETAWLIDPPWSWTVSDGERRFGEGVRAAQRLMGEAADLLQPLRAGLIPFEESAALTGRAAANVEENTNVQRDMAIKPFPEDFLEMRKYLGKILIDDIAREGPNATYTSGWTRLDLAVGVHGADFRDIAAVRTAHMPVAQQDIVKAELALPSIADLAADVLGVERDGFRDMDREALVVSANAAPVSLRPALIGASRLARATAKLAGVHWGVIQANLVKPVEIMTANELANAGVSPTAGVSGNDLEHTNRLRVERQSHPLAKVALRFDDQE